MATRNLARTAIEGGRTSSSKFNRIAMNRSYRREWRLRTRRATLNPDVCDDFSELNSNDGGWAIGEQRDKLAPIWRWLDSRVGRRWSDVWSELTSTFDRRNIAQRHIIEDHMLGRIRNNGVSREYLFARYSFDPTDLHVDDDGVLRGSAFYTYPRPRRASMTDQKVSEWAAGRKVNDYGKVVAFWAVSVPIGYDDLWMTGYRQTERLSDEDLQVYRSLLDRQRDLVTNHRA